MLVRQYGCDLLYAFNSSSQAVVEFVSSFPSLGWMDFKQTLFDSDDGITVPVFFDLISCLLNFTRMHDAVHWLRVPLDHPAFPYVALSFGILPNESPRLPIDYAARMTASYCPSVDLVGDVWPKNPALVLTEFIRRGTIHLPARNEFGVVVGDTTNPGVLRAFWNAQAAGLSATLFDPTKPEAFAPWITYQLTRLKAANEGKPVDFNIWSTVPDAGEEPSALREILSPFETRRIHSELIDALTPTLLKHLSRVRGTKFKTALPRISTSESRPIIHFIPEMPKRRWASSVAAHCLLEVRSSTHTDQARSASFRLPYMPKANQLLARTAGIIPRDELRTQADGLSIISNLDERTIRLRAGFGDELLANMFDAAKISAALSDAGRYTDRLLRHVGGLQKCRAFKIPGVRELIKETAGNSTITAPYATQRIRGATGQTADLDRFADLTLRAGQKHPLTNAAVWDYLLRKRVFLPGSELKCEECALAFWISIDDLRSVVTCTYCGSSLVTGPLLKSNLDWKYRRSPLFSVDDSLHGSIPVFLTLLSIHTLFFSDVVAWATSMDLMFSNGTRCETDFAVASTHTLEPSCLLIGECKTNYEFNQNDLANLLKVSASFRGTAVDVYIVFSKLARFTDAELQMIRNQPSEIRQKIVLLDVDALESERPFEATKVMVLDMERLARASASHFAY